MATLSGSHRRLLIWPIFVLLLAAMAGAWFLLDPGFRRAVGPPTGTAETDTSDDFEQRVKEYILSNPEIILEAVQRLRERQRTAELNEVQAALVAHTDAVFHDPDSPVGGNPEGDVTVVEFFDYNCPYCRPVPPVMTEAEAADDEIRIVYKEFPILGPDSMLTAKAALAAHRQGKYAAFHKALIASDGVANEARVAEVAAALGLDIERLRKDMEDPAVAAAIARNLALAQALRISGTPSFVVDDEILRGATDLATLQALIARASDRERAPEPAGKVPSGS